MPHCAARSAPCPRTCCTEAQCDYSCVRLAWAGVALTERHTLRLPMVGRSLQALARAHNVGHARRKLGWHGQLIALSFFLRACVCVAAQEDGWSVRCKGKRGASSARVHLHVGGAIGGAKHTHQV